MESRSTAYHAGKGCSHDGFAFSQDTADCVEHVALAAQKVHPHNAERHANAMRVPLSREVVKPSIAAGLQRIDVRNQICVGLSARHQYVLTLLGVIGPVPPTVMGFLAAGFSLDGSTLVTFVQIGLFGILLNDFAGKRPEFSGAIGWVSGFSYPVVRDIIKTLRPNVRQN